MTCFAAGAAGESVPGTSDFPQGVFEPLPVVEDNSSKGAGEVIGGREWEQ